MSGLYKKDDHGGFTCLSCCYTCKSQANMLRHIDNSFLGVLCVLKPDINNIYRYKYRELLNYKEEMKNTLENEIFCHPILNCDTSLCAVFGVLESIKEHASPSLLQSINDYQEGIENIVSMLSMTKVKSKNRIKLKKLFNQKLSCLGQLIKYGSDNVDVDIDVGNLEVVIEPSMVLETAESEDSSHVSNLENIFRTLGSVTFGTPMLKVLEILKGTTLENPYSDINNFLYPKQDDSQLNKKKKKLKSEDKRVTGSIKTLLKIYEKLIKMRKRFGFSDRKFGLMDLLEIINSEMILDKCEEIEIFLKSINIWRNTTILLSLRYFAEQTNLEDTLKNICLTHSFKGTTNYDPGLIRYIVKLLSDNVLLEYREMESTNTVVINDNSYENSFKTLFDSLVKLDEEKLKSTQNEEKKNRLREKINNEYLKFERYVTITTSLLMKLDELAYHFFLFYYYSNKLSYQNNECDESEFHIKKDYIASISLQILNNSSTKYTNNVYVREKILPKEPNLKQLLQNLNYKIIKTLLTYNEFVFKYGCENLIKLLLDSIKEQSRESLLGFIDEKLTYVDAKKRSEKIFEIKATFDLY